MLKLMSDPILQVAAKAVIVNSAGKVLLVRESGRLDTNTQSSLYGLPGGRLNPGESFFDALKREVMEEVGLEIAPGRPIYVGEWRPVIKGVPHQIVAVFIVCTAKTDNVRLSEEHDGFVWADPTRRQQYNMMPPDDLVVDEYVATRGL